MSDAALAPGVPRSGLGQAAQRLPEWIAKNLVGLIITAAISGVVGYVVNVWLMAVRYEGSVSPEGAPAMSKDNVIAGGIFWAMLPMVIGSAIGYRRAVGKERFWRDVRRFPITLVSLFRRDGSGGWVFLLWGAAIALAATLFVPPAVGAVLGVGLLVGAPTIVGSILSSAFAQVWRLVSRVVAPTKEQRVAPILKVAVGILGWAAALIIGFVLPGEWIRLVLALVCAGAAFAIGRRGAPAGPSAAVAATVAVVVVGVAFVIDAVTASMALADDGGFAECGSTLEGWLRQCAGAGEVRRRALLGAFVATPAGFVGFVSGGLVGAVASLSGGGAWWDRLGMEDLPIGAIDPATGESLVVNDGRWTDVPVGHVYFEGRWAHPESVGAVPVADEDPFTADPEEESAGVRAELWVPPLVAAAFAGASSAASGGGEGGRREARRGRRGSAVGAADAGGGTGGGAATADGAAGGGTAAGTGAAGAAEGAAATGADAAGDADAPGAGGGASGSAAPAGAAPGAADAGAPAGAADPAGAQAAAADAGDTGAPGAGDESAATTGEPFVAGQHPLLDEAQAIRTELATTDPAADPANHERLRSALKAKALQIADNPEARVLAAADRSGLGADLTTALQERDTEVQGVFVERLNELGVQRGGRPVESADITELRERAQPQVAPGGGGGMRQAWKGYGAKKGKFAIDAPTYLGFLEAKRERNDPPLGDEELAALDRRIERLRQHVDNGVATVMVSEQIWNEVAQYAYALATEQTG